MNDKPNFQEKRKDYSVDILQEDKIDSDPLMQFAAWYDEAHNSGMLEPNAMTLATVSENGRPSARIVLLKDYSSKGFTFFTNYKSRKGLEIEKNNHAAILFYWPQFERQIRVEGKLNKTSVEISNQYFQSRPIGAQIAAVVSRQSSIINRSELEEAWEDLSKKRSVVIECPENWGGYCLVPDYYEFWQGRDNRLHDRLSYSLIGSTWVINRLAP